MLALTAALSLQLTLLRAGRPEFPEEAYIKKLDGSTGASLKLTILNHSGRVWTMVAGGGASVVYADTISDYGFGKVSESPSTSPQSGWLQELAQNLVSLDQFPHLMGNS